MAKSTKGKKQKADDDAHKSDEEEKEDSVTSEGQLTFRTTSKIKFADNWLLEKFQSVFLWLI